MSSGMDLTPVLFRNIQFIDNSIVLFAYMNIK